MWAPDVYQGSPIPVTCFFSMVPKIAGIASLIRVSLIFINNTQSEIAVTWTSLLVVVAALTMIVGNFSALNQDSVKRMLAYSSIGHVGLILLGVITMGKEGTQSILFYSFSYIFMTLVSFFIVAKVNDAYKNDSHNCFKGLVRKNPLMAISFSIALFSLAGMPPFSGFIAKFQMISVAVKSQFYGLAIIAAIMSVVSLYFYLRLVKMMLIDETEDGVEIKNFGLSNYITTIVMTAPVIVFGIFWESVMNWFGTAELFLKI
jgi:NADH-quinone oxidoreductase subunit N